MELSRLPPDDVRTLRELVRAGRFPEALELHRNAPAATTARPEAGLLVATAATRLGNLALGETLAGEALDRFRGRGDMDGRMRAVNLLGAIGFERGALDEAEGRFAEALRLARLLRDIQMAARASNNLASVTHLRGGPDEAIGLFRRALLDYQRLGDRRGTAETYHNLGLCLRQMTEWGAAEASIGEAVRHAEMVGERSLLALVVTGRAELHVDRGEYAMAEHELDRAARYAREADDEIGAAEVDRVRALLALREGDLDRARDLAESAGAAAARHGSALLRTECAAIVARALRRLGHTAEAEARRTEAVQGFRALGATTLLDRFAQDWDGNGESA